MRHDTSFSTVVVVVFCYAAVSAVLPGQVAVASEPELVFEDVDPWTMEAEANRAIWLVDDFEDGNIDGWIDEGGGMCTASTSAIAADGAYSMRVDGACGHLWGRVLDLPTSQPTGVTVWVRSDTVNTYDTYFALGDQFSGPTGNYGGIYFLGRPTGHWGVFNGTPLSCGSRNAAQWYRVTFNVDWACKMFDVSIDGERVQSNVAFYHEPTESFDRIHVYNYDDATARYDSITFSTPPVGFMIFWDDFERTSTCRWSSTTP